LADQLNKRRLQLGIRWVEVARRAGMTPQNLSRIRRGEISLTRDAAAGIERALQFAEGSVADGNPVPTKEPSPHAAVRRQERARSVIVSASLQELNEMATAYAEAFGESEGEAFLLRALEIRTAAEAGDKRAPGTA
jgi:transcriptional regulator with XRE-family HTH domain